MTRIKTIVSQSPAGLAQDAIGALAIVGLLVGTLYLPSFF